MCTLTYIPLKDGSYVVTHNRDEKFSRSIAKLPSGYFANGLPVFYPKDPESNGTWMLTSECIFTLCLLNGADEFDGVEQVYEKSRGQIILDFFNFFSIEKMIAEYNFKGYGPFTLVLIDGHEPKVMHKLTWDSKVAQLTVLDASKAQIFSSSTLYSSADRKMREAKFEDFILSNGDIGVEQILDFHRSSFDEESQEEGFVIDRVATERKTVSISCIVKGAGNSCTFYYHDLIDNNEKNIRIIE